MKFTIYKFLFAAVILSVFSFRLYASPVESILRSDVIFSENNEVVYVDRIEGDKEVIAFDNEKIHLPKDEFSLKNYPQNGLYQIKERKFLWNFDDDILKKHYFIRSISKKYALLNESHGDLVYEYLDSVAFKIYKEGHYIKQFYIKDFCNVDTFYNQRRYSLNWYFDYQFDEIKNELTFQSCEKDFKISLETGKVESQLDIRLFLWPIICDLYNWIIKLSWILILIILPIRIYRGIRNKGSIQQRQRMTIVIQVILLIDLIIILIKNWI